MQILIDIILQSGRSALDMAIYVLAPIMVVMLALMKLLEVKGILARLSNRIAPATRTFGVPGLGVFAMVKMMFVSFAAPIATLNLMDRNHTRLRQIAATFSMLLVMSQANVVYPLVVFGLDAGTLYLTSIVSGLIAASLTYYLLVPEDNGQETQPLTAPASSQNSNAGLIQILNEGGKEGLLLVFGMIPLLILSLCVVNLMDHAGLIDLISGWLAPVMALMGLPDVLVLPLVTKFIAGGTAFVGVTLDLIDQGLITADELNRMAGLAINPFDVVGVALLLTAGRAMTVILKPAMIGALAGLFCKTLFHLIYF